MGLLHIQRIREKKHMTRHQRFGASIHTKCRGSFSVECCPRGEKNLQPAILFTVLRHASGYAHFAPVAFFSSMIFSLSISSTASQIPACESSAHLAHARRYQQEQEPQATLCYSAKPTCRKRFPIETFNMIGEQLISCSCMMCL